MGRAFSMRGCRLRNLEVGRQRRLSNSNAVKERLSGGCFVRAVMNVFVANKEKACMKIDIQGRPLLFRGAVLGGDFLS